ncbi:MAG: O-methyltransferase [Candidatus Hodarchaeales archaeon]|jgi:predicted O-methyltransferase YrrM
MRPFDILSTSVQEILIKLEQQDKEEREINLDQSIRLRQIPRETGEYLFQFLTIHASKFGSEFIGLEIGTSGGYSTIWQGIALKLNRIGTIISLEIDPNKYKLAQENIKLANVEDYVKLVNTNAKNYLKDLYANIHYVFIDAEKKDYLLYFDLLVEKLLSGAVLIADNAISHADDLSEFLETVQKNSRVSDIILPIGKGLALIRWL